MQTMRTAWSRAMTVTMMTIPTMTILRKRTTTMLKTMMITTTMRRTMTMTGENEDDDVDYD